MFRIVFDEYLIHLSVKMLVPLRLNESLFLFFFRPIAIIYDDCCNYCPETDIETKDAVDVFCILNIFIIFIMTFIMSSSDISLVQIFLKYEMSIKLVVSI